MKLDIKAASEMYALALERSKAMGSSGPHVPTYTAVSVAPDPFPDATKCERCGTGGCRETHGCPYSDEIGDGTRVCNCCADCQHECAMDI